MTARETAPRTRQAVPVASWQDTLRVAGAVLAPVLARGVIVRRPRMMALAERIDADRRAGDVLRRMVDRYGPGPVLLRVPGRSVAVVLDPRDVRRVLRESPSPFAPDSREKRASLAHFQPGGVLISHSAARAERRRFVEAVLETGRPLHHLAGPVAAVLLEETERLSAGPLGWDEFADMWWRTVRRVVLGDTARDDQRLTDLLRTLRRHANWSYLAPPRPELRQEFQRRVRSYLSAGQAGSLAEAVAHTGRGAEVRPEDQVAHWLFAFDAAGMTTFRTLAVLGPRPRLAAWAAEDPDRPLLPRLRACVLDTVRLWPTTPVILRDTTTTTEWRGRVLPAGTALAVLTPFFHRDERTLPYAHTFTPEIWLDGRASAQPALVPFSDGPGRCPGQDLVLFTTSTLLGELLGRYDVRLDHPTRLSRDRPLPGTLDPFSIRLHLTPR